MEVMHGLSIMDSPSSMLAWLCHARCLPCQDRRPTLASRYGTIPGRSGQLSVKTPYHWTAPLTDREVLCSNRDRHKFWGWINLPSSNCSLATVLLVQKYIMFYPYCDIWNTISVDLETCFTAKKVQSWTHIHGLHWSYQSLHYSEELAWQYEGMVMKVPCMAPRGNHTLGASENHHNPGNENHYNPTSENHYNPANESHHNSANEKLPHPQTLPFLQWTFISNSPFQLPSFIFKGKAHSVFLRLAYGWACFAWPVL